MSFGDSMRVAEHMLVDGATLEELREAARNLRALTPDSALAELVEAKIGELERLSAPHANTTGSHPPAR